jgi:hypothetical protein
MTSVECKHPLVLWCLPFTKTFLGQQLGQNLTFQRPVLFLSSGENGEKLTVNATSTSGSLTHQSQ